MTVSIYDIGLERLDGFTIPIYVSQRLIQPAQNLASRFAQAYTFLTSLLPVKPDNRTLAEFEAHYDKNDWSFENYLWYHGVLFTKAQQAFERAGVQALQQLWQSFVGANVEQVSDTKLLNLLFQAQPELARMVEAWAH